MRRFNLQAIIIIFSLIALVSIFLPKKPGSEEPEWASINEQIAFTSMGVAQAPPVYFQKKTGVELEPAAQAAIVKRLGDNTFFYARNNAKIWPMASLTKLMTAVVALEKFSPGQIIIFNDKIVAAEGTAGGFRGGEAFRIADVLRALMLVSSNDAALALAENYGYEKFLAAMRAKAKKLGMRQTNFADPTGLSFLNQSTIEDLEKLVLYAYRSHPQIFQMTTEPKIRIGGRRDLININQFAGQPDFLGGKTGYTTDSQGNLISLFGVPGQAGGRPLLIIVLGTDDRFGETEKLLEYYRNIYQN